MPHLGSDSPHPEHVTAALGYCPPGSSPVPMSGLALERCPLNLRTSSGHHGRLFRTNTCQAGLLNLSPASWGGLAAASPWLAVSPLPISSLDREGRRSPVTLCLWTQACPGRQQHFGFGNPNLVLTAISALSCHLLYWF